MNNTFFEMLSGVFYAFKKNLAFYFILCDFLLIFRILLFCISLTEWNNCSFPENKNWFFLNSVGKGLKHRNLYVTRILPITWKKLEIFTTEDHFNFKVSRWEGTCKNNSAAAGRALSTLHQRCSGKVISKCTYFTCTIYDSGRAAGETGGPFHKWKISLKYYIRSYFMLITTWLWTPVTQR